MIQRLGVSGLCSLKLFRVLVCLHVLIIGIVLIGIACVTYSRQKNWVRTEAVIQSIDVRKSSDDSKEYTVIVRYRTEDGDSFQENLNYHSASYREGMKIPVCYDPDEPSEVVVGSNSVPVSTGAAGVATLAICAGLWVFSGKKMKEYGWT